MDEIKRPMVSLFVNRNYVQRENILAGIITGTIRPEFRDYREGDLLILCCPDKLWIVDAKIKSVRHCLANQLNLEECKTVGYKSLEETMERLKKYYPNIKNTTPVTYINWTGLRGKVVDRYYSRIKKTI